MPFRSAPSSWRQSTHVAGLYEHSPRLSCHSRHFSGGAMTCIYPISHLFTRREGSTSPEEDVDTYSADPAVGLTGGAVHLIPEALDVV